MFLDRGRTRTILLLAILLAAVSGCRKKSDTSSTSSSTPGPTPAPAPVSAEGGGNPITSGIGRAPAQGDIRRGAERQVDQNLLSETAKFYIQFNLENNHSPANVDELVNYMRGAPGKFTQALKDGWIVMVPNARTSSNTVILYEKHVYQKANNRLAAFGDGHVQLMAEPEFQAALKAGGP
jgi:hypothetical protein